MKVVLCNSKGNGIGIGIVVFVWGCLWMVTVTEGAEQFFKPFNVSYDHRALTINGKHHMLISAEIHYPGVTPEMWLDLIAKSKESGQMYLKLMFSGMGMSQ